MRNHGEPGCDKRFREQRPSSQGRAASRYDATSARVGAGDPAPSTVVGKVGYAMALTVEKPSNSGWLYTWARHPEEQRQFSDAAWKFISWMTDKTSSWS